MPPQQLPLLDKRWNQRRQRFIPPDDRLDPSLYTVAKITAADARAFTLAHHYSGTFVAARLCTGLIRDGRLVGIAAYSHPMSDAVLTKWLGHRDGCELGRFILLDSEPFNSETWFLARSMRILRVEKPSIRAIVSFADPVARSDTNGEQTKPEHFGGIYRAANATLVGRSSPRSLILAPNGTSISPRALSKIRGAEKGRAYAQRFLEHAGISHRNPNETARDWLRRIEPQLRRIPHPGNLTFTFQL